MQSVALMFALACTLAGPGAFYELSRLRGDKGRGWEKARFGVTVDR